MKAVSELFLSLRFPNDSRRLTIEMRLLVREESYLERKLRYKEILLLMGCNCYSWNLKLID